LAVDKPQVDIPKNLVSGLALNAIAMASPELAVASSINTATLGFGFFRTYGLLNSNPEVTPFL
jgi:hypothetical protein